MKKAVKVLLGIVAAGASASAAAIAVKKYRDSRKKYICDECEEDYSDDFDGEYHLTPEEEEELLSTDDYDFGAEDNSVKTDEENIPEYKKLGMDYEVSILEPVDVAFAKYMLEGIRNIGRIMYGRMEDIERLTRRRNISNSDKLNQIRHLCAQNKENYELLCRCADDVEGTVCEKIPDDFWEFYSDYEEREGNSDGE
ncbi:MAG: hypothetical protein J6L84_03380 [Clostridiales bacterium]|nr:hypothetical protein [Clostridiales bacterium]